MLRYRVEETDDGLAGEEGTFTICSFWLVSALAEIGELSVHAAVREAALLREPLGLYAEEIDPADRTAPGQLPAGVHPPRPDQRGHARRQGGAGGNGTDPLGARRPRPEPPDSHRHERERAAAEGLIRTRSRLRPLIRSNNTAPTPDILE